jgi:hypothetical protein
MSTEPSSSTRESIDRTRVLAILRAVASGRVEMTCSCEPDMYIDGLPCCNQYGTHDLALPRTPEPVRPGLPGRRVPARLTVKGFAVFDDEQSAT